MVGIETLVLGEDLRVHAIRTGEVAVKPLHRDLYGWESVRFPRILMQRGWTDWMPIWVWVIEHSEGILLIDTGENPKVLEPDYFDGMGFEGWVNRRILRFRMEREEGIVEQLKRVGIVPNDVRWVVLTHMHLDHVDGLMHFPKAEIVVSETEYATQYGVVPKLLPSWFAPHQITYSADGFGSFEGSYALTKAEDVLVVPTPGHSLGHQSVLLRHTSRDYLFAGDVSFTDTQLLEGSLAGICADLELARASYRSIRHYATHRPTVYMPSHDPNSAQRLVMGETLPELKKTEKMVV